MTIYMPKDPRYEGWGQALSSLGQGMKSVGDEKQKKTREKGLLELQWLQSQGGTFTEEQLSGIAKDVGLPLSMLLSDKKAVMGAPDSEGNREIRYHFDSPADKELAYTKDIAILKDKIEGLVYKGKLERTIETAEAISDVEVGAKKAVIQEEGRVQVAGQKKLLEEKQQDKFEMLDYTNWLAENKILSPMEAEALRAKIDLAKASIVEKEATASYLTGGKSDEDKRIAQIFASAGKLNLLETSGPAGRTMKVFKTVVEDSDEYDSIISLYKEMGIEYIKNYTGDKTLLGGKRKVRLIPKRSSSRQVATPVIKDPSNLDPLKMDF